MHKHSKLIRFVPTVPDGYVNDFDPVANVNRIHGGWYMSLSEKQKEVVWRAERSMTIQEVRRIKTSWMFLSMFQPSEVKENEPA